MTTDITQPASAEAKQEIISPLENPTSKAEATASEQPDEWDKERAKETILKLREIEKQAKKDAKEFERLKAEEKKRLDEQLSETERLSKEKQELADENARLKTEMLRREVAQEVELPAILVDRIKGTTKEEMLADAKELKKSLPLQKSSHVSPTNPAGGNVPSSDEERRKFLGLR